MKLLLSLLLFITFSSVDIDPAEFSTGCKNSEYILAKSKEHHDPNGKWEQTELTVHIQEPRVRTPLRYTKLVLNNATDFFSLIRDSEIGEVNRMIDSSGQASVLVNGSSEISDTVKEEYRLNEDRNFGYRSFYQLMYGLPMSISDELILNMEDARTDFVEEQQVHAIPIELEEPMISKHWELLISLDNYKIKGLKFIHADGEDELIMFDGSYSWDKISIPRFRHWYLAESKEYLGSDVIVTTISGEN